MYLYNDNRFFRLTEVDFGISKDIARMMVDVAAKLGAFRPEMEKPDTCPSVAIFPGNCVLHNDYHMSFQGRSPCSQFMSRNSARFLFVSSVL